MLGSVNIEHRYIENKYMKLYLDIIQNAPSSKLVMCNLFVMTDIILFHQFFHILFTYSILASPQGLYKNLHSEIF